jgi:hypothetical protein
MSKSRGGVPKGANLSKQAGLRNLFRQEPIGIRPRQPSALRRKSAAGWDVGLRALT